MPAEYERLRWSYDMYYPEIHIPDEIVNILYCKEKKYPVSPKIPYVPRRPKQNLNKKTGNRLIRIGCFGYLFLLVVISFFSLILKIRIGSGEFWGTIGLILGVVLPSIGIILNNIEENTSKKIFEYENKKKAYEDVINSEQYQKYRMEISTLRDLDMQGYRKYMIEKFFENNKAWHISYDKEDFDLKKEGLGITVGYSELDFIKWLKTNQNIFEIIEYKKVPCISKNDYYRNTYYKTYDYISSYYPDLILRHKQYNFLIDVEIDEPYSLENHNPIHFKKESHDEKRNGHFIKNNWIVIRFSERQIVKFPDLCFSFLESFSTSLINGQTDCVNLNTLFYEKKWTREEAVIMAKQNYREKYLKI